VVAAGDLDRAETIARSITDPYQQAEALAAVAQAVADAGDLDRAETIARSITDPYQQVEALAAVARRWPAPVTSTGPGIWPATPRRSPAASPTRTGRWRRWPLSPGGGRHR